MSYMSSLIYLSLGDLSFEWAILGDLSFPIVTRWSSLAMPSSPSVSSNLNLLSKPPDPGREEGKLSFAAAAGAGQQTLKPRFSPIPLPARQYGTMEGRPSIPFTLSEYGAGADCFQYSLIAKFTVGRPPIAEIKKVLQANWQIKGRATISDIFDGRHLLIILDSEEDVVTGLTSSIRKIQHAWFRLFRYTADYNPKMESTTTTKWVRLPGLPPPLCHKTYIGAIVNSFAHFLDVDMKTKACASMRYARACVEIDVAEPIPDKVWISLPNNKSFWQTVEVEGNMSYCAHCKIHGHDLINCRKKKESREESRPEQQTKNSQKGNNNGNAEHQADWQEVSKKKPSSKFKPVQGVRREHPLNEISPSSNSDKVENVNLDDRSKENEAEKPKERSPDREDLSDKGNKEKRWTKKAWRRKDIIIRCKTYHYLGDQYWLMRWPIV